MGKNKQSTIDITDQPQVTLQDFVIPAKIRAFCEQYQPQNHWTEDCDVLGDPLSLYLQELEMRGFKMQNDVCGEPVIYCKIK